MELLWNVALLALSLVGAWFGLQLILAIHGTAAWVLAGETGGLMIRGFLSKSRRFRRTVELQAIVTHVATVVRANLPLAPAIHAASIGERGRTGRFLGAIAESLTAGGSLADAFREGVYGCPLPLVHILRTGERCGQTNEAIGNIERMMADRLLEQRRSQHHTALYISGMLTGSFFVVLWLMYFVVPKFKDIFMDFDTALPPITLLLIDISDWMFGFRFFIALAILACLFVFFWLANEARSASGTKRLGVVAGLIASLRWAFPPTRSLDYGLGMASAIRSLSAEMRAGVPLDRAKNLAYAVARTNRLRIHLADFTRMVANGDPPHRAAREAGLGKVFVSVLRMIERGEPTEQSLRHAGDYYQAIANRWWHAISAVSGPLVTLATACVVGFIVLALFLPLVQLISSVAESIV